MPDNVLHSRIREAVDAFCAVHDNGTQKVTLVLDVRECVRIMDALLAIDSGTVMGLEFRDDTMDAACCLADAFETVTLNRLQKRFV